jgi:hypothetical protein
MNFTGSISVNRITVGLPPTVRQELADEARRHGLKVPELIRHLLLGWFAARQNSLVGSDERAREIGQ